ncbi:MAG: GNAT family N-acetyltransferase [Bacteroidota bacterium]
MIVLRTATTESDYNIAMQLFQEYAADLGFDLSFQNFDQELATIGQQYGPPSGTLSIVLGEDDSPLGCAGIKKFEGTICELKRMYLRPEARGQGVGKKLLQELIAAAKELGYIKMRLDTLPSMSSAIGLYKSFGFYEIEAYRYNPFAEAVFFELDLTV